jgi:hypothetical protein
MSFSEADGFHPVGPRLEPACGFLEAVCRRPTDADLIREFGRRPKRGSH